VCYTFGIDTDTEEHTMDTEIDIETTDLGTGAPVPEVTNPATDKQVSYLRALADERDFREEDRARLLSRLDAGLDKSLASESIDWLLRRPRRVEQKAPSAPATPAEEGFYYLDGCVYKVQNAVHGSGNNYAKVLGHVSGRWSYAPGMVMKLREEHRMTMEQAREFGRLYGVCARCGRTLTDEESIAAGIGPVCAGKGF